LNLRPLDPQSARSHLHPSQPGPPLPTTRINRLSASASVPPCFRAACDNSVTTSQPAQPTDSKPAYLEMPSSKPDLHQTRPRQPSPLSHHPAPAAHGNPSRHPSIRTPHPLRHRAVSLRCATRHARACRPQHQCTSRGSAPHTNHAPDPDMSKVTTCPANTARHQPSRCQPTTATNTESSSFTPDSPLPGSPNIG